MSKTTKAINIPPTKEISEKSIKESLLKLARKIEKNYDIDPEKTLIIGIARGGMVPAQYLSYMLEIRNIVTISSVLYNDTEKNVNTHEISNLYFVNYEDYDTFIVVDDLYDTGQTLENIVDALFTLALDFGNEAINIIPVVMFTKGTKEDMKHKHIEYGKIIKTESDTKPWLVFPWDKLSTKFHLEKMNGLSE